MSNQLSKEEKKSLLSKFPRGSVFLDVEATGLSPLVDRMTELAAIKLTPDGEVHTFQTLIDPQIPIPPKTVELNQISNEMLKDSPTIEQVLPEFLSFAGALPLIAHNAKFDLGFLIFAAHKQCLTLADNNIYCSYLFARKAMPHLSHHSLAFLAKHLQLPTFQHHRAQDDARICMQIMARSWQEASPLTRENHRPLFNTGQYKSLKDIQLPSWLSPFLGHIHEQRPVLIRYAGGTLKMDYRPIKPSALLPLPHGPILHGFCLISEQYKSFVLKKLKDIKPATPEEITMAVERGKGVRSYKK